MLPIIERIVDKVYIKGRNRGCLCRVPIPSGVIAINSGICIGYGMAGIAGAVVTALA